MVQLRYYKINYIVFLGILNYVYHPDYYSFIVHEVFQQSM